MSINLKLPNLTELRPRITVIGVGGAGGNAVNNMITTGLTGVDFVVANTDAQALMASSADHTIQLGVNLTEGLGAGSKPEIGEAAAEEAIDEIRAQIEGAHMVFVAAGMGGGTGTGAAPVIARIASEAGTLTVGVVTLPFQFEGTRRMRMAEAGIAEMRKHVDTLIVIPNQNLFRIANEKTTFAEAFVLADQVLHSGVACITDLIVRDGLINLDFADVRTIMTGMGSAMMGMGEASGERRAHDAAEQAIFNPLLDDVTLRGAKGLLVSISGNKELKLYEVHEAANRIRQEVDSDANIIVGATFDETLGDAIRVSIVASGLTNDPYAQFGTEQGSMRPQIASRSVADPVLGPRSAPGSMADSQEGSGARVPDWAAPTQTVPNRGGTGSDGSRDARQATGTFTPQPAAEVKRRLADALAARNDDMKGQGSRAAEIAGGGNLESGRDAAGAGVAEKGVAPHATSGIPGQAQGRGGHHGVGGGRVHDAAQEGDVWHGPDGVTISPGRQSFAGADLPRGSYQGAGNRPAASGQAGDDGDPGRHGGFVPQAPMDGPQRARRIPDVEDFPVIAQKDYAAKKAGRPPEQPPVVKKRGGLFGLFGSRSDKQGDSSGSAQSGGANGAPDGRRPVDNRNGRAAARSGKR